MQTSRALQVGQHISAFKRIGYDRPTSENEMIANEGYMHSTKQIISSIAMASGNYKLAGIVRHPQHTIVL